MPPWYPVPEPLASTASSSSPTAAPPVVTQDAVVPLSSRPLAEGVAVDPWLWVKHHRRDRSSPPPLPRANVSSLDDDKPVPAPSGGAPASLSSLVLSSDPRLPAPEQAYGPLTATASAALTLKAAADLVASTAASMNEADANVATAVAEEDAGETGDFDLYSSAVLRKLLALSCRESHACAVASHAAAAETYKRCCDADNTAFWRSLHATADDGDDDDAVSCDSSAALSAEDINLVASSAAIPARSTGRDARRQRSAAKRKAARDAEQAADSLADAVASHDADTQAEMASLDAMVEGAASLVDAERAEAVSADASAFAAGVGTAVLLLLLLSIASLVSVSVCASPLLHLTLGTLVAFTGATVLHCLHEGEATPLFLAVLPSALFSHTTRLPFLSPDAVRSATAGVLLSPLSSFRHPHPSVDIARRWPWGGVDSASLLSATAARVKLAAASAVLSHEAADLNAVSRYRCVEAASVIRRTRRACGLLSVVSIAYAVGVVWWTSAAAGCLLSGLLLLLLVRAHLSTHEEEGASPASTAVHEAAEAEVRSLL